MLDYIDCPEEVLAIKTRMREAQAKKALARVTKASAVVRLGVTKAVFTCYHQLSPALALVDLVLIVIKVLFDYLFITGVGD